MKRLGAKYHHAVTTASIALGACNTAHGMNLDQNTAPTGTLQVTLISTPPELRCLQLSIEGDAHATTRQVDLAQGEEEASLGIDRLPPGLALMDAFGFTEPCPSVTLQSIPHWVAAEERLVRIEPNAAAHTAVQLITSGSTEGSVELQDPAWLSQSNAPIDIAVIADTPYGAEQIASFPKLIRSINADPNVSLAVHVGDIKNGGSRCDDEYFALIARDFATFEVPLVYTPGDNEWTDCHRASNGGYDPVERLDKLRQVFFATPGLALGAGLQQVLSQASFEGFETFAENQFWIEAKVAFSAIHIVGSANGSLPWYGDDATGTKIDDPQRRNHERQARTEAALAWLDQSFALATEHATRGAIVFMHGDTFSGKALGFSEVIPRLADLTRRYARPVLLIQGDSHNYRQAQPLRSGSDTYGIVEPVPLLTWISLEGETVSEWLKVHVDASQAVPFSWERIQL